MRKLLCVPFLLSLLVPLGAVNADAAPARNPTVQSSTAEADEGSTVVLKGRVYGPAGQRVRLQKRDSAGWKIIDRTDSGKNHRFRFSPTLVEGANEFRVVSKRLASKPLTVQGRKKPKPPTCATDPSLCPPPPTCETDPTLCPPPPTCETDPSLCPQPPTCETDPSLCPEPPSSKWPDATNTGVPAGTVLTAYTGPCTLTSAVTIRAADVKAKCNALVIQAKGVIIERSRLPRVDSTYQDGGSSVTISDSTVQAGNTSIGAVWGYNINATRLNITGGQHSFHCNNNCVVTDSWLHDQYNPDGGSYHNNAFISNGGSNMTVRHNTLHCTAILNSTDGGCTADLSLFGDFDPIDNVLVENNLFKANNSSISYCAYGGDSDSKPYTATNVRFVSNVFERGANRKCGVYGPVTSFDASATGNVWANNVWEDGAVLNP